MVRMMHWMKAAIFVCGMMMFTACTANKNATVRSGILADVAPSVLHIMGLQQSKEMTGQCLISDNPSIPSQQEIEESLVGLWYEEFAYEDEYSSELIKELGATNHETAALSFFLNIIEWISANYK